MSDQITLNSRLGTYANFTNLMDIEALALPTGFTEAGIPFDVTLMGLDSSDKKLSDLAAVLAKSLDLPRGGPTRIAAKEQRLELPVVGAHMTGLPLNHELTSRGGQFIAASKTAPS